MRLIDVDALIETMRENAEGNEGWYGDTWAFMRDVENAPTIDAVPVVRCKDCKHWDEHSQYGYDSENGVYGNYCMLWTPDDDFYAVQTPEDGFCFVGERKDNG